MNRTFTKLDSQAMKGAAILLMLLHHLFYSADSSHGIAVTYLLFEPKQMVAFARFCKICVPAFVFVTAYGMTLKYNTSEQGGKSIAKLTIEQYVSLMVSFLFVYVLALVFCQISGMRDWKEVYGTGARSVLYAFLDMAGMTYFTETPTINPTWWYMSVAVMLIFLLPFMWRLVKKTGFLPIPLLAAGMLAAGLSRNQALLCILTAFVGVWCAEKEIFKKVEQIFEKKTWYGWMEFFLYWGSLSLMLALKLKTGNQLWIVVYPVSAFALAGIFSRVKKDDPLYRVLCFFGKYSMGMFLTHTFIKSYYLHDFVYGFHYAVLIYAVLILISTALSAALLSLEKAFRRKFKVNERLLNRITNI